MYGFDVKQPASIADAVVALKEGDEQALGGSSIITNTRAIAVDALAVLSLDGNGMMQQSASVRRVSRAHLVKAMTGRAVMHMS